MITNQCVNCGSTFAARPTAHNHVVNSWTRGTCLTDRSHMPWSLDEVTQPISCNLCAQELGDLQTCHSRARLTHLPFPAPTIRASWHAQPVRQPRRNKQHARSGHEREPRGRQLRRTPSRTKHDGGASGSTTVVATPKADTKFEQKSLNKILLKAILKTHQTMRDVSSTVWDTLLIMASSPEADTIQKTDADLRRKGAARGAMTHPRASGHTWA